jgi:hypothetical protein
MGAGEVARYLAHQGAKRIARTMLVAPTTTFALKAADNPDGADRAVLQSMTWQVMSAIRIARLDRQFVFNEYVKYG